MLNRHPGVFTNQSFSGGVRLHQDPAEVIAVPGDRHTSRIAAVAAIAVAIIFAAWLAFALFPSLWAVQGAVFDWDQSAGPDRGVNLAEVANHPEAMWEREVTISATVERVFGLQAMLIGHNSVFIDEDMLILAPVDLNSLLDGTEREAIQAGDIARVSGVVQRFEPEKLAMELSVDSGDPAFSEYNGTSVLVAGSVQLDPPAAVGPGDKEFPNSTDGYDIGITAFDLTDDPDGFLGEPVTVTGEIERVFSSPHAFFLSDHKLLVISAEPRSDLFVEATAYVTGAVRLFDLTEIEEELGINLDNDMLAGYQGELVVVASIIEVIA